jgi:hypothetical protein
MRKQIFAPVIRGDEPVSFCVVEPLDSTSCHKSTSSSKRKRAYWG